MFSAAARKRVVQVLGYALYESVERRWFAQLDTRDERLIAAG